MYSTNVDFTTYKPRNKPITPKMERDKDSQIQYYEEMIKYYSDKLKELGQSEEISERKKYYMNKLVKLLK